MKAISESNGSALPSPFTEEAKTDLPIDILDRQKDVDRLLKLINVLSDAKSASTFAFDGKWGSGKTFVLEMLERELVPYIESGKYVLFHYNCWQNDYYEEPLMAIIAAMLDNLDSEKHLFNAEVRKKWSTALHLTGKKVKDLVGTVAKAKIGIDPFALADDWDAAKAQTAEEIEKERQFDTLRSFTKAIKKARHEIEELAVDQTLIVVVDELDRCLPEYAIKVLERLHHLLYGTKNVIVIISVDKDQLNETVKRIFGANCDTTDYLKKFIDFEVELSSGSVTAAFKEKYANYFAQFEKNGDISDEIADEFFSALFEGTDIRTQEHIMNKVIALHRLLPERPTRDVGFACFEVLMAFLNRQEKNTLGTPWIAIEGDLGLCHLPNSILQAFRKYVHRNNVTIIQNVHISASGERRQLQIPNSLPYTLAWYNEKTFSDRNILLSKNSRVSIMEDDVADFKQLNDLISIIK